MLLSKSIWPYLFTALLVLVNTNSSGQSLPYFQISEKESKVHFQRGLAHFNRNEYSAAREEFLTSLSIKPDFTLARKLLSKTYFLSGDWNQSLSELETLDSMKKLDVLEKNRLEVLRILLGGSSRQSSIHYFDSLSGDSFRHNRFRQPTDVATDKDGNLFILSFETANVIKLDPNGIPLENFKGSFGRNLQGPLFFHIKDPLIFISDFRSDQVYIFETDGSYENRFGEPGSGPAQFHGPAGISLLSDGSLVVADTGNNRIQKISQDGKFLQEFGKDYLQGPSGIFVDENDQIFVADKGNKRIAIFDQEGNFLKSITNPNLSKPRSLSIHQGRLYIADEDKGLIIYDPDNNSWKLFARFRDHKGIYRTFDRPFSSTFDYSGTLYVADFDRHRVEEFVPVNQLSSNLDLFIEKIDRSRFPDMSIYLRLKDRSGRDIRGLSRRAFRILENTNVSPLIGRTEMTEYNDRVLISVIFENSQKVKDSYPAVMRSLRPLLTDLRREDQIEVIRAGSDAVLAYPFGHDRTLVQKAFRAGESESTINLGESLYQGISDLLGKIGPRAVVLVVSGDSLNAGFGQYSLLKNIQYAKAHSVPVFVLSLEENSEMTRDFKQLAEETGGGWAHIPNRGFSRELRRKIQQNQDRRYILTFESRIDPNLHGTFVPISVDASFRNAKGKDEFGFFIP